MRAACPPSTSAPRVTPLRTPNAPPRTCHRPAAAPQFRQPTCRSRPPPTAATRHPHGGVPTAVTEVDEPHSPRWSLTALTTAAATLAPALAAAAADAPSYDATAGSDFLKNVAGAAYVVLLVVFAFRLLRRRATTATTTRFASTPPPVGEARPPRPTVRATPGRAAWGAFQALAIATLLYQVCVRVDAFFDGAGLPDGYTQRNIAVTLRTVGRGLAYLLTFIYAANGLGLAGLAVQLVFYPDDEGGEEEAGGGEEEEERGEGDPSSSSSLPPPPA